MRIPFPDEEYLLALGKLSYAVGYLEWAILGDIPSMPGVPEALTLDKLVGLSTGQIGRRLIVLAEETGHAALREWLLAGGEALIDVAGRRNSVLHARPATIDGKQRLHRWEPAREEVFSITEEVLQETLDAIDDYVSRINELRWPTGRKTEP